jgi:hypothetical protein
VRSFAASALASQAGGSAAEGGRSNAPMFVGVISRAALAQADAVEGGAGPTWQRTCYGWWSRQDCSGQVWAASGALLCWQDACWAPPAPAPSGDWRLGRLLRHCHQVLSGRSEKVAPARLAGERSGSGRGRRLLWHHGDQLTLELDCRCALLAFAAAAAAAAHCKRGQ